MSKQKIQEEMWCFHCGHSWVTDDYYNCNECPNCKTKPIVLYRKSSTAYIYALAQKDPNFFDFSKKNTNNSNNGNSNENKIQDTEID